MSKVHTIGIIGARGYTGSVLLELIAKHDGLRLAFAGSREFAGVPVHEVAPGTKETLCFEAIDATTIATHKADLVVLALPDGAGEPFVEAFNRHAPDTILIDLSADYRFNTGWAYGLPELARLQGRGDHLKTAKRIANPGCYATAMQLGLAPLKKYIDGVPSIFGVSGYSGAGTKPSPNNDLTRLESNLVAYKLIGHNHEREATRHLGFSVRFTPHVHPAFSGIVTTVHVPLSVNFDAPSLKKLFENAYDEEPLISIMGEPPTLKQGTDINGVLIGGFEIGEDGRYAVIVIAEDNLRKGAGVQAMQNINLALGFEELTSII